MAYSDQKFYSRHLIPHPEEKMTSTATFTASGHVVTNTAVAQFPKFPRRTEVTGGVVTVRTAPDAAATTTKLIVKNGANTAVTFTVGTLTAGEEASGVLTAANAVFAAAVAPTVDFVGTGTASTTVTLGNYDVFLEVVERPA